MADREACTDTVEEEQVTTEETKNGKTIKTTTTTRKTNGGQEEVETTVEEEEASEDEEEDEEEEEEEEDDEEEEEVEVVEEVEEDIKEIVGKEKKESEQRNVKEEEQEEDNDSDYEEVEVVEVVEVEESDEEDDSKDSQEVKVETVKKLEESVNGNEVKNQNTTVKVEEDGTKVITTTTTVVKETSDPKKTESRELVLSSKEDVNLLMDKPHISQSSSASQEGESLLLPLLQGLLHKNMPTNRNQSSSNSNPNKIKVNNNLGTKDSNNNKLNHSGSDSSGNSIDSRSRVTRGSNTLLGSDLNPSGILHHVEDSGTESGEDLKLIAAGLRNSMHRNVEGDEDSGDIIEDVTVALKRLESSLLNGKDIKLDPHKRNALLVLVGRLQTGLKAPENISVTTDDNKAKEVNDDESETKRPSRSSQRFAKRRSRANRHTVGVSREELADARRYIEEMVLLENISNCTTPESNPATTPPEFAYNITKEASLGNLKETSNTPKTSEFALLRPNQFLPSHLKGPGVVASPSKSVNDKPVQPVQMREKKSTAPQFRQSLSLDTKSDINVDKKDRPLSESYANLQFQQKLSTNQQQPVYPTSSRDLDKETVNQRVQEKNLYNKTHHFNQPPWVQSNPNNMKVPKMSAEAPSPTTETKKSNKFITKKMMMKRANTIDIPKPLKYMNDMDSDSEAEDNGLQSTKSIGLRGTVQVNIKHRPKQVVPSFEPKTENDHKFLAFIQKQQTTTSAPAWNNPKKEESGQSSGPANWTNKFGNIKNTFEAGVNAMRDKPPMPMSSARNFWKKTEQTNVPASTGPKFYEKPRVPTSPVNKTHDKIVKPPWSEQSCNSEVVTGSLRIKEPPSPRLQSESPKIIIPKPIPVNKFSHAPMSAFKPVAPPKAEPLKFKPIISEPNPAPIVNGSYIEPMYKSPTRPHHSPQRPLYPQNNVVQSPTMSIPWAAQPNIGNRVLNRASKIQSKQSFSDVEQMYQNRDDPPSDYGRIQPSVSQVQHSPQYNYAYSNKQLNSPGLVRPYQNVNQTPLEHSWPGQHVYGHSLEGTSSGYSGSQYNRPSVSVSSENCNQTSSLSTYSTDKYSQNDSLINPNAQPLILTHDTPVISPQLQRKQEPLKIFDYPSPSPTTCTTQYEMSDDGLDLSEVMEYKAESKVMQGPVSQQAVTVTKRTSHIGDEKNTVAAKNLLTTMRDIGNKTSGTTSNMPQKTSPAPIFPGFRGSFTDVVFPADPMEESNMSSGDFSRTGPAVNEFNTTTFSAPLQSYVPPARNTTLGPPPQITYTSTSQISNAPGPQVQSHSLRPQKALGSSPSALYPQNNNKQDRSSLPTTPTNESKNTYYSRSFSHQTPGVSVSSVPAAQPNYRPNEQIIENHQRQQQSQLAQRKSDQENMEIQGSQRNLMSLQQTSQAQAITKPSARENDLTKSRNLPQSELYGGIPQQKSNNSYGYQHNSVVATFSNKPHEQPHFETRPNQTIQKNDNSQYNVSTSQKSSIISAQREQIKQSEKVESFSMPHYQKNLVSSSQAEDDTGRPESPVKASAPKTDKIPVFKKFGPAQPHLYTPNSYQYPLSSQPQPSERRNRFQNRVGSAQAPRKYSEPEIKFSEYKTKQTSQTTLAVSHTTDQSKFQAPQIIETPSTPLTASKNDPPPNIIYNNVGQRPMIRQTFETTHDGESVVSYKFPIPTNRPNVLSKSDSWHQICQQSQQVAQPPSPRSFGAADAPGLPLRRAKSGHTLAIPKMYEAGIDKSQVVEKQRTVAAYFSGQKSPSRNSPQNVGDMAMASTSTAVYETKHMTSSPTMVTTKKSSINRIKTSSKASIGNQNPSSGLVRSQTMPHIPNVRLLDESNVEDAFEQILNCS